MHPDFALSIIEEIVERLENASVISDRRGRALIRHFAAHVIQHIKFRTPIASTKYIASLMVQV
jgi:hypothetical protein